MPKRASSKHCDTRIVTLVGPRQSGKTTLARKIATDRGMNFITLDDEQFRQFAIDDPAALNLPRRQASTAKRLIGG